MSRLKERYKQSICQQLLEKFDYKNVNQVPRLLKVVIAMGIAEAAKDKNAIQDCINELSLISGQKPVICPAKKSISNFKLREGQPVGMKVTLRGERMFDFVDRFVNIHCPRIRDFRGLHSKCDGRGNYTVGLEDQQIFTELNLDLIKRTQGMHITFVTTATRDEECVELLRLLGMPFEDQTIVVAS